MSAIALIVLLSAALPLVSADCYSGGTKIDKGAGISGIGAICPALVGSYKSKEPRSGCSTVPGSGEWVFQVRNIADNDRQLTLEACIDGLRKEVTGCDYGGHSSYTNWYYRADPSNGKCQDNESINLPSKRSVMHIVVPYGNTTREWNVETDDAN